MPGVLAGCAVRGNARTVGTRIEEICVCMSSVRVLTVRLYQSAGVVSHPLPAGCAIREDTDRGSIQTPDIYNRRSSLNTSAEKRDVYSGYGLGYIALCSE